MGNNRSKWFHDRKTIQSKYIVVPIWLHVPSPKTVCVQLGKSDSNVPVYVNLLDAPHVLIGGMKGGPAKSFCSMVAKNILSIPKSLVKKVLFFSQSGYKNPLAGNNDARFSFYDDPRGWARAINEILAGMTKEILKHESKTGGLEFKIDSEPATIIVFDDLLLALSISPSIYQSLLVIAQKGRCVGYHLILTADSRFDSDSFLPLAYNLPTRICFSVDSEEDSVFFVGCPDFGRELKDDVGMVCNFSDGTDSFFSEGRPSGELIHKTLFSLSPTSFDFD
jgi:hypothetical protein